MWATCYGCCLEAHAGSGDAFTKSGEAPPLTMTVLAPATFRPAGCVARG